MEASSQRGVPAPCLYLQEEGGLSSLIPHSLTAFQVKRETGQGDTSPRGALLCIPWQALSIFVSRLSSSEIPCYIHLLLPPNQDALCLPSAWLPGNMFWIFVGNGLFYKVCSGFPGQTHHRWCMFWGLITFSWQNIDFLFLFLINNTTPPQHHPAQLKKPFILKLFFIIVPARICFCRSLMVISCSVSASISTLICCILCTLLPVSSWLNRPAKIINTVQYRFVNKHTIFFPAWVISWKRFCYKHPPDAENLMLFGSEDRLIITQNWLAFRFPQYGGESVLLLLPWSALAITHSWDSLLYYLFG